MKMTVGGLSGLTIWESWRLWIVFSIFSLFIYSRFTMLIIIFCLKWKTHHWFFTTCHSCEENQLFGWKSCQFCHLALIFLRYQLLYFKNYFPIALATGSYLLTIKLIFPISQVFVSLSQSILSTIEMFSWTKSAKDHLTESDFTLRWVLSLFFLLLPDKNMTGTLISLEPFSFF